MSQETKNDITSNNIEKSDITNKLVEENKTHSAISSNKKINNNTKSAPIERYNRLSQPKAEISKNTNATENTIENKSSIIDSTLKKHPPIQPLVGLTNEIKPTDTTPKIIVKKRIVLKGKSTIVRDTVVIKK